MRRPADLVAYRLAGEFEGVVADVTGAGRVDVGARGVLELSRREVWAYRLRTVFETEACAPTSGLAVREARLQRIAHHAREGLSFQG